MVRDSDLTRRSVLRNSFRSHLEELDLLDRIFETRPNSISPRNKKTTWETENNVKIIFEGSHQANNITKEVLKNGEEVITITAASVNIK